MVEPPHPSIAASDEHGLRKELGLRDLVLAQILCVVGSSWVGVAAKLGSAHLVYWLGAMLLFYAPLAITVNYLNREWPLEGGLYQWAKAGFGPFLGFLTAWNLWVYAVIVVPTILFVIPTDLAFLLGRSAEHLPHSRIATLVLIGAVVIAIAFLAIRGLSAGKRLHNAGSFAILVAYAILIFLPAFALLRSRPIVYQPFPWRLPPLSWFTLAVFGQMTVGGLSGFEYIAILAGEARHPARTIGRSVLLSAPIIALMFILGTSSVLAFTGSESVNLIGPIPQTLRAAFGVTGLAALAGSLAILLLLCRAVAAASLLFTGLTRLPMTAGWDHLLPEWFTALHSKHRTPVHSIWFVVVITMALVVLSMLGVHEQEAAQLLGSASVVHYGLAYVALFALPLFGNRAFRSRLPKWLPAVSILGLGASLVSAAVLVYPIINIESRAAYAAKIGGTVVATNLLGLWIYRRRQK